MQDVARLIRQTSCGILAVRHADCSHDDMKKGNPDSDFRVRIPFLMGVMLLVEDMQIAFYRYATEFVFVVFV